jgi:hypothetical protein
MPRFYLHVCDGAGFCEDELGVDLPNEEAPRAAAISGLRDLAASAMRSGTLNLASFVEVENEDRRLLFTVQFMEAVEVTSQRTRRRWATSSYQEREHAAVLGSSPEPLQR